MDDPSHNSPPSSRKSSVIGKLDRPETPNRGSPYLTRSRRSSTLTEENIAVHNDTPTTKGTATRRITRRMSQSNETNVVLTPMPQVAKRTRRSPSVTSDDLMSTPKKKFTVAQENVVIEEDETMEENKLDSTGAGTNGTKIANDGDKENINTIVNGNATTDETQQNKSPNVSDSNKNGSVVEQPNESKVTTESVAAVADKVAEGNLKSDELPVDVSATIAESIDANVSSTQSSTSKLLDQNSTINSQTAVATNEQGERDPSELSFDADGKSTTETNSIESPGTTNESPKLNDTSVLEVNDTVLEMKTPTKLAEISASDVIVIPDTPNPVVILVPDTPIQKPKSTTTETPVQAKMSPTTDDSKVLPSAVESVQQEESPKTPVQAKTSDGGRVTRLSTLRNHKVVPSSVQQEDSPKTPVQTKTSDVAPEVITPVTSLVAKETVPVAQQVDSIASPKTPRQTKKTPDTKTPAADPEAANKIVDGLTTPKSTKSNVNAVDVTESEEEILLKSPSTPIKTPEQLKSKAGDTNTDPSIEKTPKVEVESAKTASLQNGILSENDEPISQKSDGKSNEKVDVNKLSQETAASPSKDKPTEENTLSVHVLDSSEEDSETELRNRFIHDEAMESNGEDSMDEEERKYLEENEIPEEGIELGSESDESMSEEENTDDSFIVSDDSAELLDGSGDDLELENDRDASVKKPKRRNQIVDTSDDEAVTSPKKSAKKRRPESSLNNIAKYSRVDDEEEDAEHTNVNESGEASELANVDVEPKKTRSSRRLSEATSSPSKKDTKRLSLHPNMKLSSQESGAEESNANKNDSLDADDNSEEDVTQVLANMDEEPKRITRSKRLSESLETSKKEFKRKSLHPNTKLGVVSTPKGNEVNSVDLSRDEKQTTDENEPGAVGEINQAIVEEELANLDSEPKTGKDKKRLSEVSTLSKKEMKRLSLHPNTKLSSLESNEDKDKQEPNQEQQSKDDENDLAEITVLDEAGKDVEDELANIDDEPKLTGKSKRLSDAKSPSKINTNRLSLHSNAKSNRTGFDFKAFASTIAATTVANDVGKVTSNVTETDANEQSAPSDGQEKADVERSVEEIQAKCNEVLQKANEVRRIEKLNKEPMEDDKYQRLKEKKTAKLQKKKMRAARQLEREEEAAKQRQLKREKKLAKEESKTAEITEKERQQAIQKALDFSEKIKVKKIKHSMVATESSSLTESTEAEPTTPPVKAIKRKRKPKRLQILNEEPNAAKKVKRVADAEQIPAKPEGFKSNSIAVAKKVKSKTLDHAKKVTKLQGTTQGKTQPTSAGSFEVEQFVVTTVQSNPDIKLSSTKDTAILNSNVKRVSAAELLNIKKTQMKMKKK